MEKKKKKVPIKSPEASAQSHYSIGEIRITDEHSHVQDLTEQLKIKFNTGKYAHNPSTVTLGQSNDPAGPLITNE